MFQLKKIKITVQPTAHVWTEQSNRLHEPTGQSPTPFLLFMSLSIKNSYVFCGNGFIVGRQSGYVAVRMQKSKNKKNIEKAKKKKSFVTK